MQIDWFTLVAQMGNFLILVYLLKRFLYDPIVKVMDEREQKIATQLRQAEKKREQAEAEANRYRQELQALQAKREEMLARAKEEVEAQRGKLLEEAREEVDKTQMRWHQAVQHEKESLLRELSKQVVQQSTAIARRALMDLANTALEQQMVDAFIRHIRDLSAEEKERIASSIRESGGKIIVRSAFALPQEKQQRLTGVMQDQIVSGKQLDVRFEVSPELISGIELQARGYRVAWTIQSYLQSLEERMSKALEERMGAE